MTTSPQAEPHGPHGSIDILSPAAFAWPERIVQSAWLEHGPFAFWLIDAVRPRCFVELGTHNGFSYMAFCQAVKNEGLATRCHAVDRWEGDPHAGYYGEDVYRELHQYNQQHYAGFSTLIRKSFDKAAETFADGTIDLLHIDGLHTYDAVRGDFERWLPKLSERGVVLFHDIAVHDRNFGVWRLWDELRARHPHFDFEHGHGLGVLCVGPQVPAGLRGLLDSSPQQASAIRLAFTRLGKAVAQAQIEHELFKTVDDLRDRSSALDVRVEELNKAVEQYSSECDALQQTLDATESELDYLSTAHYEQESELHRVRGELGEARHTIHALLTSTSWRAMSPVRATVTALRSPRRAIASLNYLARRVHNSVRLHGLPSTVGRIVRAIPRQRLGGLMSYNTSPAAVRLTGTRPPAPTRPAPELLALRVLIIAEVSIPQCLKYRVTQKQAMIESLGYECTVLPWNEIERCFNALQTHAVVIFYRVPGFDDVMRLIAEAKTLRLPTFWEVDDVIFDAQMYLSNSNLEDISGEDQRGVLEGVPLYRSAMLACDAAIASTEGLAKAMHEVGMSDVSVIENALDSQTLDIAASINAKPRVREPGIIRIVYGSGTKTHDADFRVAAEGLLRLLKAHADVRLCIAGELNLPDSFEAVAARIERFPLSNYPRYMQWLSEGDINIAPLEASIFNDAKSNIKYLEAAALQLPSVCSPCAAFRSAIDDGRTGLLAASPDEWFEALSRLVGDAALRERMGQAAHESVLEAYAPDAIAARQVLPVMQRFAPRRDALRALGVNIYFAPRSFGGATIIAEEMAKRLNARADTDYAMFTTLPPDVVPSYQVTRFEAKGSAVYGMGLPHVPMGSAQEFDNPETLSAFKEVLKALRPDIVHFHSIQGIGATIAKACRELSIPYAITLHDAWWMCGRQFMITGEGVYCNQREIDLDVCAVCVPNAQLNNHRQRFLANIVRGAQLLLAPSAFFRDLYIANGIAPERIVVNKNGILPPAQQADRNITRRPGTLRFGYVGGNTTIKGIHLIKAAFKNLLHDNYELVLVDNMLNMGSRSILESDWELRGSVSIVPAYTQETIEDFFGKIDVLLFPTQWKESFGLTVREALIRDVWVIATDAGGVIEDIVPGENGDIVPLFDDGSDFERAIKRLLDAPERLAGFENPHKAQIRLFDAQAEELRAQLQQAVAAPAAKRRVRRTIEISKA